MIRPVFDQTYQQNPLMVCGDIRGKNAILILTSPRNMTDHFKRPYTYNFNNEVIESVGQFIVSEPAVSHTVKMTMNSVPAINHAIVPSNQLGIPVATSAYSESWTFVFIVDDDDRSVIKGNDLVNRRVYIGLCSQEPISQMGLNSATPEQFLNPNCQLVVTKQLMLKKYQTASHDGYRTLVKSSIDENIVQYDPNIWGNCVSPTNDSAYYKLTPGMVHNRAYTDMGRDITITDHSDSLNNLGSMRLQSNMESPRQHMTSILKAIEGASENVCFSARLGDWNDTASSLGNGLDDDRMSFISSVHANFAETERLNNIVSNSNLGDIGMGYLTIGMLVNQYRPRIYPVVIPKTNQYEIIPQSYNSINNVFSSMVCSVIPTYLNATNLSEIAFMYNSYNDATIVHHVGSPLNVDQQSLQFNWKSFEHLLRTDLYPVLRHNGGDFDLQVMSTVNGTTNVVLNFLDWEILPFGSVYQENSNLGGITSQLIGNTTHLEQNAIKINELINQVSQFAKAY